MSANVLLNLLGERGGSVVECQTPEREVGGSKPTAAVLCPWARHFTARKYWLIIQEVVAPSRHDWKIVDWDVKPQHKQHKLLNLLNELGEKIRCEAVPSILSVFPNAFNKFSNTEAQMQDSVYHMKLKSHFISKFLH